MVSLEKILNGNKSRFKKSLIAASLSLALSGCGGGGSGNSNDTNTNPTIINTTAPVINGIDKSRVDGKPVLYIDNNIRDINGLIKLGVYASDADEAAYGKNPLVDMKITDQNGNVIFDGACNYEGGDFYSCTSLDLLNLGGNSLDIAVTATDSVGTPVLSSTANYNRSVDINEAGKFNSWCNFFFAGSSKELSPAEISSLVKPVVDTDPEGDNSNIIIVGVHTVDGVLVNLINGKYSLGDRSRITFQNKDEYGAIQKIDVTAYSDPAGWFGDFSYECVNK